MNSKTFLITGASSGIGWELSLTLALKYKKINLILAARNIKALKELEKKIKKNNPNIKTLLIQVDLTNKKQVQTLIIKSFKHFKKIDFFVLNAGISMWQPFKEITDINILEKLIKVNYLGIAYPLYYAYKEILKSRPKIVIVSSSQSFVALPNHSGYVASKYATSGFLDTLRQEDNLDITEILLGWVRGTSLRENSLGKIKEKPRQKLIHEKTNPNPKSSTLFSFSIDLKECVAIILKSFETKKKYIYAPKITILIPWAKLLIPKILYKKINQVVNKEGKSNSKK